jgi:large subunit ribosomal protein L5
VPKIKKIVLHSMVPEAMESSSVLHVAGMVLQALSNNRAVPHKAKHNVAGWGLREGKYVSLTTTMEREDAYHFLAKLVDVVLPRIKEWKGVPGSTGDESGNIGFGLTPEQVTLFPEVEVNYDA